MIKEALPLRYGIFKFRATTASILDAQMLGINDKQPITIIERLRTANHQPVIYCLDKIAEDYLTCSDYQVSDGSMLNAIETNTDIKSLRNRG